MNPITLCGEKTNNYVVTYNINPSIDIINMKIFQYRRSGLLRYFYLSIYPSTQPFVGPWPLYAVGRTPWMGDELAATPLPAHRTA
jgi:hypothetical protein